MPKFRLVKVSPLGKRTDIISSHESESLIEAGVALSKKNPAVQFAVADELGFIIWPEWMKRNTVKGSGGWGALKQGDGTSAF